MSDVENRRRPMWADEHPMSELKPCPWCAGAPELITVTDGDYNLIGAFYGCDNCGYQLAEQPTEEAALAVWNRRPPGYYPSEQEMDAAQREQDRNGEAWAILFHDTDMPPHFFYGEGAEKAARRKYHSVRSTYNCVLLCPATIRRPPGYREGAEAMRENAVNVLVYEIASATKYRDAFERMGNDESVRARQIDIENLNRILAAIRALPLPSPQEPTK